MTNCNIYDKLQNKPQQHTLDKQANVFTFGHIMLDTIIVSTYVHLYHKKNR